MRRFSLVYSIIHSPDMKVLLIEDEPKMVWSIKKGFEEQSIDIDTAMDGSKGRNMAESNDYTVIISDVVLPGENGIDVLRMLREKGNNTPVILLTALGQTEDKVTGFEAGADDYLTKPFEFRELLMRVRALARRPVDNYQSQHTLRYADLEMNLETKEFFREKQKITLTPREFALMEYLMRNPGRVISKTEIAERVWNLHFDTGTNFVEVYVNFLRKKVEKGFARKLIHTQFKTGYIFREME